MWKPPSGIQVASQPKNKENNPTIADATGNEPNFDLSGQPAGKVSSGAHGYHVEKSLALAYLRPDIAAGAELEVMILGRLHRVRVLPGPAFDGEGKRLRA